MPPVATRLSEAFNNSYLFLGIARSFVTSHFVCKYKAVAAEATSARRRAKRHEVCAFSSYRKLWHFNFSNMDAVAVEKREMFVRATTSYLLAMRINCADLFPHIAICASNELDNSRINTNLSSGPQAGLYKHHKSELRQSFSRPPSNSVSITQINRFWNSFTSFEANNLINLRWRAICSENWS
jgi:hypothetical protein